MLIVIQSIKRSIGAHVTFCQESELPTFKSGRGTTKSLALRSLPLGGVLQEIQLGQKSCHDLELRIFLCSPLPKVVNPIQEIGKRFGVLAKKT
jgi:hypothetical protein